MSADDVNITRQVSETYASPSEEIEICVLISGMQAGGIIETIPEGWTFDDSDHPTDRTLVSDQTIIFGVEGDSEIFYHVTTGAGGGAISGVWEDVLDCTNGTIPATSVRVGTPSSGGDDSDTIRSELSATNDENAEECDGFFCLDGSQGRSFSHSDTAVEAIRLSSDGTLEDVAISVERVNRPSMLSVPEGVIYTFLNITCTGEDSTNVTGATIEFNLPESWVEENNVAADSVALMRYTGSWTCLDTEPAGTDGNVYRYTASSPGFSTFVITGSRTATDVQPTVTVAEKTETTNAAVTVATPSSQPRSALDATVPAAESSPGSSLIPLVIFVIAIVAVAGYLVYAFHEKKEGDSKE